MSGDFAWEWCNFNNKVTIPCGSGDTCMRHSRTECSLFFVKCHHSHTESQFWAGIDDSLARNRHSGLESATVSHGIAILGWNRRQSRMDRHSGGLRVGGSGTPYTPQPLPARATNHDARPTARRPPTGACGPPAAALGGSRGRGGRGR